MSWLIAWLRTLAAWLGGEQAGAAAVRQDDALKVAQERADVAERELAAERVVPRDRSAFAGWLRAGKL